MSFNSIQDQRGIGSRGTVYNCDVFQFYPRSTQLVSLEFHTWLSWLSILSKINEEIEEKKEEIRKQSFNSIQDQPFNVIVTLSMLKSSFNSIQDQPCWDLTDRPQLTWPFQFYPRSTQVLDEVNGKVIVTFNSIQDQHEKHDDDGHHDQGQLSILSKINNGTKFHYPSARIFSFNSIQDQRDIKQYTLLYLPFILSILSKINEIVTGLATRLPIMTFNSIQDQLCCNLQ